MGTETNKPVVHFEETLNPLLDGVLKNLDCSMVKLVNTCGALPRKDSTEKEV